MDLINAAIGPFQNPIRHRNLSFDKAITDEIAARYVALRGPEWANAHFNIASFVSGVVTCARVMIGAREAALPEQDERRERINQLAGALLRLHETVMQLDVDLLIHVIHEDMEAGQRPPTLSLSLVDFLLAGELRTLANDNLPQLALAAQRAAKTLPVPDRQEFDPRLRGAMRLNRLFVEHALEFEVKDAGFAADCFLWAFELANPGRTKDRPKRWLKKAAEHPDGVQAQWRAAFHNVGDKSGL